MKAKQRCDELLVARGLAPNRSKAEALILTGSVLVEGQLATKAGELISANAAVKLISKEVLRYVSRGGLKLEEALRHFGVSVKNRICLDVGASTGGFTDCLLHFGAQSVYALDVGRGQLHEKLRKDERVKFLPNTNARYLKSEMFDPQVNLAAIDVAFISLEKILPAVAASLQKPFDILALVKPQYECPRGFAKKGIVRDEKARLEAVSKIASFAQKELGLTVIGHLQGSYPGPKGNIEYFLHLKS